MKITKVGHCCMIIEEAGLRILTDPGVWSDLSKADATNLSAVLITHEHSDHYDPEAIKNIVSKNPDIKFISNTAVGKLLKQIDIDCEIIEQGQATKVGDVIIEGFGEKHAEIYNDFGQVQNTGFMVADKLFYPGDAFTNPGKQVNTLALPVCGPWLHIKESINYALALKPTNAFPAHDGMLKINGPFHMIPKKFLEENKINFIIPELYTAFDI
jgi:L-ascorbate metabolism protein UlaG (beta-lactamase superfamily)